MAIETAVRLRTPVVLLTSKEMVMNLCSFDISGLEDISKKHIKTFEREEEYYPYKPDNDGVPPIPTADTKQIPGKINCIKLIT